MEEARPTSAVAHVTNQDDADKIRSEALATTEAALPKGYYRSTRVIGTWIGISVSLVATYFVFQASAAVITTINTDIGPSANVTLFSTVWTVGQPISILLFGRLSDRFGRRNFILGANVLAVIGAIVGATAQSVETLIGSNVLLGLASGPPASYPLLTGELMKNEWKFLGTVLVVLPNCIATGLGAYIGQRLIYVANWRWIYYIFIMMMVPGTLFLLFFYFPPTYTQLHGKKAKKLDELKKMDFIGVFLLVAGLALFLLGISWGGNPAPWTSAKILGLLISGAISIVAFILYEVFLTPAKPIIPMRFFRDIRGFSCLFVISSIMGIINIALFIIYPSQVVYVFGSTSTSWEETAWLTSTAAWGTWAGIILVGPLFHVIRHVKSQLIVGSVWATAFIGAMASIKYSDKATAIACSFLSMFAVGWGEVITMLLVQYVVSDQDLGVGFAVVSAARTIFGSIFTAAFISIYTNKLPGKMESIIPPAVIEAGLPAKSIPKLFAAIAEATPEALEKVPGMTNKILQATNIAMSQSYSASFQYIYYFGVALGVVCIIAAVCTRDFDQYLTDHVSRQIHNKSEGKVDPLEVLEHSGATQEKGATAASASVTGSEDKDATA